MIGSVNWHHGGVILIIGEVGLSGMVLLSISYTVHTYMYLCMPVQNGIIFTLIQYILCDILIIYYSYLTICH